LIKVARILNLLLSAFLLSAAITSYGQANNNHVSNSLKIISDSTYLYFPDSLPEIWHKDNSLDIWKIGGNADILTFNNSQLRLWRQGNQINLWVYDKTANEWKARETIGAVRVKINDSISFIPISDSIKWVEIKARSYIFKSSAQIYIWNKNKTAGHQVLNDTVDFHLIDDSTRLWLYKDKSVHWKLNKKPKTWKISNSTIVWTIDAQTEFWKAGTDYNIWNSAPGKGRWERNTAIVPKKLDSISESWTVNPHKLIIKQRDSIQIWQPDFTEKIWRIGDTLRIWKIKPPKIEIILPEPVVPEKQVKKAEFWKAAKTVSLWTLNDSMKVFRSNEKTELWRVNKSVNLWKISDSAFVWNINEGTKLSMISDTLAIWLRKNKSFEWIEDSIRKPVLINQNLLLLEVNDSCRFTKIQDTSLIWNSFGSVRITSRQDLDNFSLLRDTIEIWQANDSTKLWIGKYDDTGQVWERNKKVNILNINDSTKIWQISDKVRLSIIDGKMKIWRQGIDDPNISWRETKEFKRDKIDDSTKVWYINESTIIWETRQKIEVWNLIKKHEIYRLTDTTLIYTYSTAQVPKPLEKPKFWTYLGTGKMDIAQVWVDQWAKGGENSITTLFIMNFQANYSKRKVKWNNDFEYRYGFIKPGDRSLRKNEDKIKINSVYNYYAFKNWYYGFTASGLTQFFKGYKYQGDTVKRIVSDFLSPVYFTAALGMNYFPVKQLSVFFSPFTGKSVLVRDTVEVNQLTYGVPKGSRAKHETGIIMKSILNWNITSNINILSKLDLFTRYTDLKKYNIDWENTITFKFTKMVQATLNTHLIYDPDVLLKQPDGTQKPGLQFKEVFSIGFFYKIP
jgi:hypothetical protein